MSSRRPLSRTEKSVFVLSGVGILLLAGLGYFNFSRNAIPDVAFPPLATLPQPNGFDLYLGAAKSIVPANPAVDAINDTKIRTPVEAANLYNLKRKSAWLQSNSKTFALFDQAMKTPTLFPNPRSMNTPPLGFFRELARCKIVEANIYKLRKQPEKAVGSALDCIQMGADISQNANLIGMLVGTAIQAIGSNSFEDEGIMINALDASAARVATNRLALIAARNPSFIQAIQQERWAYINESLTLMRNYPQGEWRKQIYKEQGARSYIKSQFVSPRMVIDRNNREFDEFEAYLKTPYSSAKEKNFQFSNDDLNVSIRSLIPRTQFNEARRNVSLKLLLLRLALRVYAAEHGAYPADLGGLIPDYLKVVPTDDFGGGQPLRYRCTGATYSVWSVGPDGKNDNGKAVQGKRSRTSPLMMVSSDSLGDWVAGKNR